MGKAPGQSFRQQTQRRMAQRPPPGADRQHENAERQKRRRRRFMLDAGAMDQRAEGEAGIGQSRHQKRPPVDDDGDKPKAEEDCDDADGARRIEICDAAQKPEDERLHDKRRGQKMQPERDIGLCA